MKTYEVRLTGRDKVQGHPYTQAVGCRDREEAQRELEAAAGNPNIKLAQLIVRNEWGDEVDCTA